MGRSSPRHARSGSRTLAVVGVALGLGGQALACGSGVDASAPSTGTGGASTGTSTSTWSTRTWPTTSSTTSPPHPCDTSAGCAPGPAPAPQPCDGWPGWETWDDDVVPNCSFCVPASKAALPEPILWEPCLAVSGLGDACRQMKVTWTFSWQPLTAWGYATDAAGQPVLFFGRDSDSGMALVADADGPVRSAFLVPANAGESCSFSPGTPSSTGAFNAFTIRDKNGPGPSGSEVLVGGPVDELRPKVLWRWNDTDGHDAIASDDFWAATGHDSLAATWGGAPSVFGHYLWILLPAVAHDFFAWGEGGGDSVGDGVVVAYTPAKGIYPFLGTHAATLEGQTALGTDGVDLVWITAEFAAPGLSPPTSMSVTTAPFTTDPLAIQPRRLRSYASAYSAIAPWVVGCGRAAYATENGVLVMRLSDGVSWAVPNAPKADGGPSVWDWSQALGLTCDELFVETYSSKTNIARIALSALGEGTPPD